MYFYATQKIIIKNLGDRIGTHLGQIVIYGTKYLDIIKNP